MPCSAAQEWDSGECLGSIFNIRHILSILVHPASLLAGHSNEMGSPESRRCWGPDIWLSLKRLRTELWKQCGPAGLRNTWTLPVCRIPTGPVCWNLIFSLALILTSYEGWTTHSVSLDLFLYLVNEKFAFSIKVPWLLETCLSFISLASEAQSVSSTSLGPLVKVYTKVLRKPQNKANISCRH